MTKQQVEVLKESLQHSKKIALEQYKEFTKQDIERRKKAKSGARLARFW